MEKLYVTFGVLVVVTILKMVEGGYDIDGDTTKLISEEQSNPESWESFYFGTSNFVSQKLDNFDKNKDEQFISRFFRNDIFFETGGPIFIYVGGTTEKSPSSDSAGFFFYQLAKVYHAHLFYFEHRFYGESKPANNLTNEELKYLNAEQALADLANFIRRTKSNFSALKNSKVILFGCFYGGTLATWFSKRYPKLVDGVWASNTNMLAELDDYQKKEVIGQMIKRIGGVDCYIRIQNGIAQLESMFEENRGNKVKMLLQLSDSFNENSKMDIYNLFYKIASLFSSLRSTSIRRNCEKLMEGPCNLMAIVKLFKETYGNRTTEITYNSYLEYLKRPETNAYARTYQHCNELGWFQTTSSPKQPFGTKIPLEYFTTLCADLFGRHFTVEYILQRIKQTNGKFGGRNIKAKNVYFTYAGPELANVYGIKDRRLIAAVPDPGEFCLTSEDDSPEFRMFKEKIVWLLNEWMSSNIFNVFKKFFT